MRALLLLAVLAFSAPVAAQEVKADPLPFAHPITGEPGVWIPVWFQQEILKTEASLKICTEERSTVLVQATELQLALQETQVAQTELQKSIAALKTQLAIARTEEHDAKGRAQRNLYLAIGSAGAAVVAVSILLIEHL